MEEMGMIGKRFGDEQSTLLDEFERASYEAHAAQLKRGMLGRSLSEPAALPRSHSRVFMTMAPIPLVTHVNQEHGHGHGRGRGRGRGSRFHKVLKKLLKPFLGIKRGGGRKQVPDHHPMDHPLSLNAFSTSLRF